MSDYIKREDVLRILTERNAAWNAYTMVSILPTANVERKAGKWSEEYKCSECGYSAVIRVEHDENVVWESAPFNYCPNCGAYMRDEE